MIYPVFLNGVYRGALDIAVVETACPLLLSKYVLKKWQCAMDFGKAELNIGKYDFAVPFTDLNVPAVDILDVQNEELQDQWAKIPQYFKKGGGKEWLNKVTPPPGLECFFTEDVKTKKYIISLENNIPDIPKETAQE